MAFFVLDMDHFKEVNDVYGHVMGDNVLKMLGGFLKEQVPGTGCDRAYRRG